MLFSVVFKFWLILVRQHNIYCRGTSNVLKQSATLFLGKPNIAKLILQQFYYLEHSYFNNNIIILDPNNHVHYVWPFRLNGANVNNTNYVYMFSNDNGGWIYLYMAVKLESLQERRGLFFSPSWKICFRRNNFVYCYLIRTCDNCGSCCDCDQHIFCDTGIWKEQNTIIKRVNRFFLFFISTKVRAKSNDYSPVTESLALIIIITVNESTY